MKAHKMVITTDELKLVNYFRTMTADCQVCIMMLAASAAEYSTPAGNVVNIVEYMTKLT